MAKHLSDSTVLEIRERYEWLKDLNGDTPGEEALTPAELDGRVAGEFGVSVTTVKDIVMGLSHPDVEGPIDQGRRLRRDLYNRERDSIGETEARRRLQLRARGIDPAPKVERLAQRITVMDHRGRPTVASVTLAPGEWLKVELVAVGPNS